MLYSELFSLASAVLVAAGWIVVLAQPAAAAIDYALHERIHQLDMDQRDMDDLLRWIKTKRDLDAAYAIYTKGGNAGSVATLELVEPLEAPLKASTTRLEGTSLCGESARGTVLGSRAVGAITIEMEYEYGCLIGGLHQQDWLGCLTTNGTLSVVAAGSEDNTTSTALAYHGYDYQKSTRNLLTLQKLGTMHDLLPVIGTTYQKFYDYYGSPDYADEIIRAAFFGLATNFDRGNVLFDHFGLKPRAEAIRTATVALSVWMRVLSEMEVAVGVCRSDCTERNCNAAAVDSWNDAVALYTGSLLGPVRAHKNTPTEPYWGIYASREQLREGFYPGWFVYGLADEQSQRFRTSGADDGTNSTTIHDDNNYQQFVDFEIGAALLNAGACVEANATREAIARRMAVPLVRGTLWHAYAYDRNGTDASLAAESVFAAAVLPLVHACDAGAAKKLHEVVTSSSRRPRFERVRRVLESTYGCLGIRSSAVGGLWDTATGDYYPWVELEAAAGAAVAEGTPAAVLVLGSLLGGFVLGVLASWLDRRQRRHEAAAAPSAMDAVATRQPLIAAAAAISGEDDDTIAFGGTLEAVIL